MSSYHESIVFMHLCKLSTLPLQILAGMCCLILASNLWHVTLTFELVNYQTNMMRKQNIHPDWTQNCPSYKDNTWIGQWISFSCIQENLVLTSPIPQCRQINRTLGEEATSLDLTNCNILSWMLASTISRYLLQIGLWVLQSTYILTANI